MCARLIRRRFDSNQSLHVHVAQTHKIQYKNDVKQINLVFHSILISSRIFFFASLRLLSKQRALMLETENERKKGKTEFESKSKRV